MKPTDEQLTHAIKAAEQSLVNDSDRDHIGAALVHLHKRNSELEEVFIHVERFLQFGMPTEEHAKLTVLVQRLREREASSSDNTELDYGL